MRCSCAGVCIGEREKHFQGYTRNSTMAMAREGGSRTRPKSPKGENNCFTSFSFIQGGEHVSKLLGSEGGTPTTSVSKGMFLTRITRLLRTLVVNYGLFVGIFHAESQGSSAPPLPRARESSRVYSIVLYTEREDHVTSEKTSDPWHKINHLAGLIFCPAHREVGLGFLQDGGLGHTELDLRAFLRRARILSRARMNLPA